MQDEQKNRRDELLRIGQFLSKQFSQVAIATCASSISYFTFLSLIPLLTICISILTAVGISEQEVITLFLSFVPDEMNEFVGALISDAFAQSEVAFSLSSITLLWSVSKVARALRYGLNAAYGQQETRNGIVLIIISVVAGLILEILIAATIYLVFRGRLVQLVAIVIPRLAEKDSIMDLLNALATMAISAAALALCYAYLPDGKRSPLSQWPGAVIAVLACALISFGFRLYVDHFGGNTALYGSIATVALFLIWVNLLSNIIILGGFFNRVVNNRPLKERGRSRESHKRARRLGVSVPLSKTQNTDKNTGGTSVTGT